MHTVSFKHPKSWSTHMPMLLKVLLMSTGDVVEVGGGVFSTPLLHWLCKIQNRKLITYEDEPEFYRFTREFQSQTHSVRLIKNWDEMDFKTHRGVVFIDHHPEHRRGLDAIRFKDSADFIVMHDTERPEKYNYAGVWEHFKYVRHDTGCKPWTSVVSNKFDLSKLAEHI